MKKLFLLLSILLLWVDSQARTFSEGITPIDTIAPNVSTAIISVRAHSANGKPMEWGLVWNMIDDANYDKAVVCLPDAWLSDFAFPERALVKVCECRDGYETVTARVYIDDADAKKDVSFKLMHDGYNMRVYAGADKTKEVYSGRINSQKPTIVAVYASAPIVTTDVTDVVLNREPIYQGRWDNIDALRQHLAQSTDPIEGYWEYLDRDVSNKAALGGKYRFAITETADLSGYEIIYLSGADDNYDLWAPLNIKGTLSPTEFQDNYDLLWQCSDGTPLYDDNYATLSPDRTILTLHFPLLSSQLRLHRTR